MYRKCDFMSNPKVKRNKWIVGIHRSIKFLSIFCIFAFILTSTPVTIGKTTISDLEKQMKENEEAIKQTQASISSKNAQIAVRHSQILDAESEIAKLSSIIFGIENEVVSKEEQIEVTQGKLEEAVLTQKEYYLDTKERIKVMYEYGSTQYLEVLLEAKNSSDFFNRMEYLSKLINYDQKILDKLEIIREEVEGYKTQLIVDKANLVMLKDENTANLNKVEQLRATKEIEINSIEEDKDLLLEQIEMMKKEQEEIDKMIQELIRLYADSDLLFGDGKLSWPLKGYTRVSSEFGNRTHPVFGYKSFHSGFDLPAPYGTPILAAASGQVIFAGWNTAYGNYILMDHGKDTKKRHIVTQYAHCSSMLVVKGDIIIRGEVIGKVGSTGWSTGNHLHFGVQVGGEWIDPRTKTQK
jgi:murein DD-endopeptidase MepM/ murein hydrolase activator NlpD